MELRQASLADAEFIYRRVEATMRSYVEQIWGSFSEEYNRKNIADTIAANSYSIIRCGGEDVGAISVERHPDFIQLSQLYILPQHQRKGVGTSLVRELVSEARSARKPLRLRVLKSQPRGVAYMRGWVFRYRRPRRNACTWS